jgi:peroxiredoxin
MRKLVLLFVSVALMMAGQNLSGRRAPSFALPDSTLKAYDILDYRGRWLLIEFLRTDCPHCKMLTQTLDRLKLKLGNKAAVLAIVVPPDNTATVSRYITETKTTSPILFDSGQTAMWYFNATPSRPSYDTPHLFAINPQGTIVRDWTEAGVEAPGFAAEVEALMAGGGGKK